jgi:hypothetical protein
MTLKDRITEDMKAAMRAREAERLSHHPHAAGRRASSARWTSASCWTTRPSVAIVDKLIKQRKDSHRRLRAGRPRPTSSTRRAPRSRVLQPPTCRQRLYRRGDRRRRCAALVAEPRRQRAWATWAR